MPSYIVSWKDAVPKVTFNLSIFFPWDVFRDRTKFVQTQKMNYLSLAMDESLAKEILVKFPEFKNHWSSASEDEQKYHQKRSMRKSSPALEASSTENADTADTVNAADTAKIIPHYQITYVKWDDAYTEEQHLVDSTLGFYSLAIDKQLEQFITLTVNLISQLEFENPEDKTKLLNSLIDYSCGPALGMDRNTLRGITRKSEGTADSAQVHHFPLKTNSKSPVQNATRRLRAFSVSGRPQKNTLRKNKEDSAENTGTETTAQAANQSKAIAVTPQRMLAGSHPAPHAVSQPSSPISSHHNSMRFSKDSHSLRGSHPPVTRDDSPNTRIPQPLKDTPADGTTGPSGNENSITSSTLFAPPDIDETTEQDNDQVSVGTVLGWILLALFTAAIVAIGIWALCATLHMPSALEFSSTFMSTLASLNLLPPVGGISDVVYLGLAIAALAIFCIEVVIGFKVLFNEYCIDDDDFIDGYSSDDAEMNLESGNNVPQLLEGAGQLYATTTTPANTTNSQRPTYGQPQPAVMEQTTELTF